MIFYIYAMKHTHTLLSVTGDRLRWLKYIPQLLREGLEEYILMAEDGGGGVRREYK